MKLIQGRLGHTPSLEHFSPLHVWSVTECVQIRARQTGFHRSVFLINVCAVVKILKMMCKVKGWYPSPALAVVRRWVGEFSGHAAGVEARLETLRAAAAQLISGRPASDWPAGGSRDTSAPTRFYSSRAAKREACERSHEEKFPTESPQKRTDSELLNCIDK